MDCSRTIIFLVRIAIPSDLGCYTEQDKHCQTESGQGEVGQAGLHSRIYCDSEKGGVES